LSPLAVAGVIVAGVSGASFRMIGPLLRHAGGAEPRPDRVVPRGLRDLGGALAQWPAGWLADRYDRRRVLIWFSVASITACAQSRWRNSGSGAIGGLPAAFVFGGTTFPIYSISAAHAHDWADDTMRVELSAALMFFYALGAIFAPLAYLGADRGLRAGGAVRVHRAAHVGLVGFGICADAPPRPVGHAGPMSGSRAHPSRWGACSAGPARRR
jgi:MFS family permease